MTTDQSPGGALSSAPPAVDGYELDVNWARLPDGWCLGQTAVATDANDNVYLFNRSAHPMIVLDRDGQFLRSWGEGLLAGAHGIFIDRAGDVYLPLREASVVLKCTGDGAELMTLGTWGVLSDTGSSGDFRQLVARAAGPFNRPTDVAVAPSGEIYVSDGYGNCRVHRYAADGRLIASWGLPGNVAPGHFHVPHGVWVHTDGRVLVADRENNRIQVFSSDGGFLTQWCNLQRPSDIFVGPDGIVYVAELDSLVALFNLDGDLLARWHGPTGKHGMHGGHSVWVDSRGDIYLGQNQEGQRLLKYSRR